MKIWFYFLLLQHDSYILKFNCPLFILYLLYSRWHEINPLPFATLLYKTLLHVCKKIIELFLKTINKLPLATF